MHDDEIPILAAAIYRDRVYRARSQPIERKILAGGALFDDVRERMVWGIKSQFPDFSDDQVMAEYWRRVTLVRRREQQNVGELIP